MRLPTVTLLVLLVRARLNVTRAIRSAISRIRDRAPDAAAHLDQAVRTGTRCSYSPPDRP